MNGQVLAIAVIAAVAACCLVRSAAAHPGPARPAPRPVHRRGSGAGSAPSCPARPRPPVRCGGRWSTAAADRLGRCSTPARSAELELRLRRAGLSDVTVAGYRRRQLAYTVGGFAVGILLALLLRPVHRRRAGRRPRLRCGRHVAVAGQARPSHRRPQDDRCAPRRTPCVRCSPCGCAPVTPRRVRSTGSSPGPRASCPASSPKRPPRSAPAPRRSRSSNGSPPDRRTIRRPPLPAVRGVVGPRRRPQRPAGPVRQPARQPPRCHRSHDGQAAHRHGPAARRRDRPDPDPVHRRRPALDRLRQLTHQPERNRP